MQRHATPISVQAAAVSVGPEAGSPFSGQGPLFPIVFGLVGKDRFTAVGQSEQSSSSQSLIPDLFSPQSWPWCAGQQEILRVHKPCWIAWVVSGLPVGGRGHDPSMDESEIPAAGDEFAGQPVQQFRVGRRCALFSEIGGSANQPLAEAGLPQTIHGHACGQGIFSVDQPAGQLKPVGRVCPWSRLEHGWDSG